MKKILIVNNNMHIGGVQRALVNLLQSMHDSCEITLLLLSPTGPWMDKLPSSVKRITINSPYRYFGLTKYDDMTAWQRLCRGIYAGIARLFGRKWSVRLMAPFQKSLKGYDVAISFLHSGKERSFYGGCNEFVLRHVKAERKITYLHCDFSRIGGNTKENRKLYDGFDRIAACSEGCKRSFLQCWPELEERVALAENFFLPEAAADERAEFDPCCFHVVSVARLDREKGIDRGIHAVAGLTGKVCYHIVGSGVEEAALHRLVRQLGMESRVHFYGEQAQPWKFIRGADLLLIPSVSEGAPMVVKEAAALGTPVLSVETGSARELIADRGFGWVCENSEEAMKNTLKNLLEHPEVVERKRFELKNCRLDNSCARQQFQWLIQ